MRPLLSRKGQGISVNMMIIMVLAVIVLLIAVLMLVKNNKKGNETIDGAISCTDLEGNCKDQCGIDESRLVIGSCPKVGTTNQICCKPKTT